MKQTVIQELMQVEFDLTHLFYDDNIIAKKLLEYVRANAKEMLEKEKEQIIDAANFDSKSIAENGYRKGEQYYFDTFKTNDNRKQKCQSPSHHAMQIGLVDKCSECEAQE